MNTEFWESGEIPAQIVDVDLWENDAYLVAYNKRMYFQFSGTNPNMEDAINYIVAELDILDGLRSKVLYEEHDIRDLHNWLFNSKQKES